MIFKREDDENADEGSSGQWHRFPRRSRGVIMPSSSMVCEDEPKDLPGMFKRVIIRVLRSDLNTASRRIPSWPALVNDQPREPRSLAPLAHSSDNLTASQYTRRELEKTNQWLRQYTRRELPKTTQWLRALLDDLLVSNPSQSGSDKLVLPPFSLDPTGTYMKPLQGSDQMTVSKNEVSDIKIQCNRCTFPNRPDLEVCQLCGSQTRPFTTDILEWSQRPALSGLHMNLSSSREQAKDFAAGSSTVSPSALDPELQQHVALIETLWNQGYSAARIDSNFSHMDEQRSYIWGGAADLDASIRYQGFWPEDRSTPQELPSLDPSHTWSSTSGQLKIPMTLNVEDW